MLRQLIWTSSLQDGYFRLLSNRDKTLLGYPGMLLRHGKQGLAFDSWYVKQPLLIQSFFPVTSVREGGVWWI